MKRTLLMMAIAATLVCGAMLLSSPGAHAAQDRPMWGQWEYKVIRTATKTDAASSAEQKLEVLFNKLGDEGWEFCQFDDGMVIFKRTKSRAGHGDC